MKKILDICHKKKVWLQYEPFDELLDRSFLKMTSNIVYKKMLCLQSVVFHFPHHMLAEVTYLFVYFVAYCGNPCSETELKAMIPCFSNILMLILDSLLHFNSD